MILISKYLTYTSATRSYARDLHLHEGTVIGDFNGEFWGKYACTNVLFHI